MRNINGNNAAEPLTVSASDTKTILILTANPQGSEQLRLGEEVREIRSAWERSSKKQAFKLEQVSAVRSMDMRRALLDYAPYLVHFAGYGVGKQNFDLAPVDSRELSPLKSTEKMIDPEGIVIEDTWGQPQILAGKPLGDLLKLFSHSVRVVILNSCYSEVQAIEISRYIPFVTGMQRAIGDRTAIEFARGFYDGLFAGENVEQAFLFGRNAIQLENIPEHLAPVLRIKKMLSIKNERELVAKPDKSFVAKPSGIIRSIVGQQPIEQLSDRSAISSEKSDTCTILDAMDIRGTQEFPNRSEETVDHQCGNSSTMNSEEIDYAGRDMQKHCEVVNPSSAESQKSQQVSININNNSGTVQAVSAGQDAYVTQKENQSHAKNITKGQAKQLLSEILELIQQADLPALATEEAEGYAKLAQKEVGKQESNKARITSNLQGVTDLLKNVSSVSNSAQELLHVLNGPITQLAGWLGVASSLFL